MKIDLEKDYDEEAHDLLLCLWPAYVFGMPAVFFVKMIFGDYTIPYKIAMFLFLLLFAYIAVRYVRLRLMERKRQKLLKGTAITVTHGNEDQHRDQR